MRIGSPYTPGAGAMPPFLAGRDDLLNNADKYLLSLEKGLPQRPVIYYGLRGVGKTVLLNAIEEKADEMDILYAHIEIAEKRSFITQIANSSKKIIHAMSMIEAAKDFYKKASGILQAFNITYNPNEQTFTMGLSEASPYITTGVLSDDLTDMLVSMGRAATKAKKTICFFIDEIQYMKKDEMEALVNALHRVNQLRLPVMLFGAGLPKVLRILGEVKSYSERLFQYVEVGALSTESAGEAVEEPAKQLGVKYMKEAVEEIIKWTKGYPYFIQELCSVIWEYTEGEVIGLEDVNRLIPTKGIVYSTGHGEIDFTVPLFDEYLKRINPNLIIEKG